MNRRFVCATLAVALLVSITPAVPRAAASALLGFSADDAQAERAREAQFDALLQPEDQREWLRRLSARPHHVGSPYDESNARYLRDLYTSFGFDAHLERYDVLFATPRKRVLEMIAPTPFSATLQETPLASDPTSNQTAEQLPPYNVYSIDGDVTAPLVYVNYGIPRDYDELARHGIDVRGKIVIARYGGSWRGIKPKVAAEHGALGCIIYSDPRDDGYWQGDAYPDGVERNPTSVQRGSVTDIPTYSGDPSSPGVGSVPGAKHLPLSKITVLTKIPTLPISWSDAQPMLRTLDGPVVPAAWRGALPFTYHIGAGRTRVHLAVAFNWKITPVYDVVAMLRGSEQPDEWILRGNHHDAWVNGAEDPLSGSVAELSEAKALGAMARAGQRPKRTIVYCHWDGEEPGLLGSTAFEETHQTALQHQAAVYINTDGNGRGPLFVEGSHSLEALVSGVADDVVDPEHHITVKARALATARVAAFTNPTSDSDANSDGTRFHIGALGSGSDYTSFVQHGGIAAINLGYGGEDAGGSYHSIFDSFAEYTRYKDGRDFAYGVTLSKTAGRLVLRFANATVLPYAFSPSAATIAGYARDVRKLLETRRTQAAKLDALVADDAFTAASDPREPYVAPTAQPAVPNLDFDALDAAVAKLETSAAAYDAKLAAYQGTGGPAVDQALIVTEQALLGDGLPKRPWYRHELYAPGYYTGYGVKTLPAIREAIEQGEWSTAQAGIASVSAALRRYAAAVDAAATALTTS